MSKIASLAPLASVLVLLVIVLGAIQGGAAPGPGSWFFVNPSHSTTTQFTRTTHVSSVPRHTTTTSSQSRTATSTATKQSGSLPQGPGNTPGYYFGLSLGTIGWYILVPIVFVLGAGMVMVLIRLQKPKVFDLKEAIKELEAQRKYFVGSWSKKMRNAALLRYYLLMAQICSKVGIVDYASDTPHQFIGRAAAELEVEGSQAEKFADVVDRAHYGSELSDDEVADASTFMDSFTKGLAGKVNFV